MLSLLCSFGHVASYAELLDFFHGQESAVVPFRRPDGRMIRRLRTNVYVCDHLDSDELAAARIGGVLDCVTVLRRAGLPVPSAGTHLHLRLHRNDGRASERRKTAMQPIRAHWRTPLDPVPTLAAVRDTARRGAPVTRLELPLTEALRQALTSCLDSTQAMPVLEALADRHLGAERLPDVIASTAPYVQRRLRKRGLPREVDDALGAFR